MPNFKPRTEEVGKKSIERPSIYDGDIKYLKECPFGADLDDFESIDAANAYVAGIKARALKKFNIKIKGYAEMVDGEPIAHVQIVEE